ncbi:MAG: hypothetical protein N4A64_11195 [Marinisporobacter sp.]|jgi:hypothetical protein|nr:hypothetical protein [Marinisporobacter sp.]
MKRYIALTIIFLLLLTNFVFASPNLPEGSESKNWIIIDRDGVEELCVTTSTDLYADSSKFLTAHSRPFWYTYYRIEDGQWKYKGFRDNLVTFGPVKIVASKNNILNEDGTVFFSLPPAKAAVEAGKAKVMEVIKVVAILVLAIVPTTLGLILLARRLLKVFRGLLSRL